eukprot:CAMPEP_0177662362 /NCGR_PEP_ID=MMETSP0447-20121125/19243_1 /TAXON_ID=0 /ORGANISM="Stygamoeba regulata, Strain BSH-02190019" /LENGTH=77 /DNA_ID=CAMNT_0019167909 /DNA_START=368 /DNA_END=601 /DNA_ORIENTATION=+
MKRQLSFPLLCRVQQFVHLVVHVQCRRVAHGGVVVDEGRPRFIARKARKDWRLAQQRVHVRARQWAAQVTEAHPCWG